MIRLTFPVACLFFACGCIVVIRPSGVVNVFPKPASRPSPTPSPTEIGDALHNDWIPVPYARRSTDLRLEPSNANDPPVLPAVRGAYKITAYCNCVLCTGKRPGHPAYGITASGTRARRGVVAADRSIQLGTVIRIPGVGRCVVEDRGGAIKGNRIDVWMPSHKAALAFGRQTLLCEIGD